MSKPTIPQRPDHLSGQEEEDLRAFEKGYDDDASGLPGRDLDRKPDSPMAAPGHRTPLKDAEKHGMLPRAGTVAPPLDNPDDDDEGPAGPGSGRV